MAQNLRWGLRWGFQGGMFFSLLALPAVVLRYIWPGDEGAPAIPAYPVLILAYFGGCIGAGLICGLLRDWAASWWRVRVVSVLAATPMAVTVVAAVNLPIPLGQAVAMVLFLALVWGIGLGLAFESVK